MRRWGIVCLALVIAGCNGNDSPVARAAGSWSGGFSIESVGGKSDSAILSENETRGNLELYVNDGKFQLEMRDRHQGYSMFGKWKVEKNRVVLTTDRYTFDSPSEDDQKSRGLKLVSAEQIRAAFGHPVVLEESNDKRKLEGLTMSIGDLLGKLSFTRPIPR